MVPTVNHVALTGPDAALPVWPRAPNPTGGYQLDARLATLQEQASGAFVNHAQVQVIPAQQLLDDLSSFQRVLFTNHRVRALSDAVRAGATPLPDPDPRLNELEEAGQGCVRARVPPLPRRARACRPAVHMNLPSFPLHFESMPASGRHGDAGPVRVRALPRIDSQRNARTYEIVLSLPTQGPSGIIPAGTRVRRTSSDPGRALLTGFVGGPVARTMTGTSSTSPGCAGPRPRPLTSTTTARRRSKTCSIITCSSSSESRRSRRRVWSRRSPRLTVCTSIAYRVRTSVKPCWRYLRKLEAVPRTSL